MIPPRSTNIETWIRKTDGNMHVVGPGEQPQTRWYPASLDELLWIFTQELHADPPPNPPPNPQAHACGSHWAMSKAAVTSGQMVETATPVHESSGDQTAPRLNNVLYDVIPGAMTDTAKSMFLAQDVEAFDPTVAPLFSPDPMKFYLFHVESGMRLYEAYSYMDSEEDGRDKRSLATWVAQNRRPGSTVDYTGPWALETMGGAGGQTLGGVASTATHGGDVQASSISDLIVAIHLVAADGQEYWIERQLILPTVTIQPFPLVDEDLLQRAYPVGDPSRPGGAFRRNRIIVIRSDDLLNAALVSCGRMGVIYSMVVRTVRQFALEETLDSSSYWDDVKKWLTNAADPTRIALLAKRFARVDVDLYPKPVFDWKTVAWAFGAGLLGGLPLALVALYAALKGDQYRCWIYSRTAQPLEKCNTGTATAPVYFGRSERGGANKGATAALEDQQDPPGTFRDPCASANWLRQFLQDMNNELEGIRNNALKAYGLLEAGADFAELTGNAALATLLRAQQTVAAGAAAFTEAWILELTVIQQALPDTMQFGDFVSSLLNTFSELHAGALIQLMYWAGANSQHGELKKPAISYAVMDRHSYVNKGCIAPGDSIECFMDATTPGLVSFIDYLLDQVRSLADDGQGVGGYISMRFMTSSPSFLAMQRWPSTCSIEIASLSRVEGTGPFMERVEEESRKRDIVLHWGQRNNRVQADLEKVFGPGVGDPFYKWREGLSALSYNGRLDNFSTAFTRYKGLEITEPKLYGLHASLTEGCENEATIITYDALDNPPETEVSLTQRFANGSVVDLLPGGKASKGTVSVPLGRGRSQVWLQALRELNGNKYPSPVRTFDLQGFATGDEWHFEFDAEQRMVDGITRWYVEINLFSQFISDTLRVSAVRLTPSVAAPWVLQNADLPADVAIDPTSPLAALPSRPVMNRSWQFFSKNAASGAPPVVDLSFTMDC